MEIHTVHVPAHVAIQIQQHVTTHLLGYCEDGIAYVTNCCPSVPPNQSSASPAYQQAYLSYLQSTNGYGIPIGWSLKGPMTIQTTQFHKQLDQVLFGSVLIQYFENELIAINGRNEKVKMIIESNPLLSSFLLNDDKSLLSYSNTKEEVEILNAFKK
eukprot:NODE_165_length_14629_cov_0.605231.p9 type:complete len:157 gc:universal NODE_165_length_14629_cov_0.605231:12273-11803(-)